MILLLFISYRFRVQSLHARPSVPHNNDDGDDDDGDDEDDEDDADDDTHRPQYRCR